MDTESKHGYAVRLILRFFRRGITPAGIICIAVGLLGCVAIYNATFHLEHPFKYAVRQLIWLLPAFLVLLAATAMTARQHRSIGLWLSAVLYISLWLVLLFGIQVNGMRGWFSWNGIFLQPGELGKPAFALLLAALIVTLREKYTVAPIVEFLICLGFLVGWVLPIALQPDFGTVLVYIFAFAATYICLGGKARYLGAATLGGVPLAALSIRLHPYLAQRILGFLRPAEYADSAAWHIRQFQLTLASGGMLGRSWGHGVWTQNYLPLGYSDSMFATIGEAIGLLGLLPFVVLLLAYVLYVYRNVQHTSDGFRAGVMFCAVFLLAGQAFLHLSVNLGIFPPTGLTLPLISYGGSSLVSTLALVGIVESMTRRPAKRFPERD